MAVLQFDRDQTSLSGGDGTIDVDIPLTNPNEPLPSGSTARLTFRPFGTDGFSLGSEQTARLSLGGALSASLTSITADMANDEPARELLERAGLTTYFNGGRQDRLLAVVRLGAEANLAGSHRGQVGPIAVGASLSASADASYVLVRAYPRGDAAGAIVADVLRALRLPAQITSLAADEVIVFEYAGGLRFGLDLRAGYQVSGAPAFELGSLQLSEPYTLGLGAAVEVQAAVAGQFRMAVAALPDPGWARVTVSRARHVSGGVAASVEITASARTEGLPDDPDDFLAGLLGLKAQNFLHLLDQVREYGDFDALEKRLDTLAKEFIGRFLDAPFAALAADAKLKEALARIERVVGPYNKIDKRALALVERLHGLAADAVAPAMAALERLAALRSADELRGALPEPLWSILEALTGGDPLAVLVDAEATLADLKTRAQAALALLRDDAYSELRRVIALAQREFPLHDLLTRLGQQPLDIQSLKTLAETKLVGLAERLLGAALARADNSELGRQARRLHEVLEHVEEFKANAYTKLREALRQKVEVNLHAAVKREGSRAALMEFDVDLAVPQGQAPMRRVGHGDLVDVLAAHRTGVAKLRSGLFTHGLARITTASVNVSGWHSGFNYQALDRVIVQSKQRLDVDAAGDLTVFTTLQMETQRERKRNAERVYSHLVLQFLGHSAGAVPTDAAAEEFLIDQIATMAARYRLALDDPDTDDQELAQYLSFADDFGLAASDEAARAALAPSLPRAPDGGYGAVSVSYDVRFTPDALRAVLGEAMTAADEDHLRRTMHKIVLTAALRGSEVERQRAWTYWTPGAREIHDRLGLNMLGSTREFRPIAPSPIRNLQAPPSAVLDRENLMVLRTLYLIEDELVEGLRRLTRLFSAPQPQRPQEYRKALASFGSALSKFDNFDGADNTLFALLDQLILRRGGRDQRRSSLTVRSTVGTQTVSAVLMA